MKILITICARKGSKGVPGKNIISLEGKPLIAYTILLAQKIPGEIDIAVSSDCSKTLQIASNYDVQHLINRPEILATDEAGKLPAIRHCVTAMETKQKRKYDLIIDLDVSSPLRNVDDLKKCIEIIKHTKNCGNLITATYSRKSPYFNIIELEDGTNKQFLSPRLVKKRGDFLSRQSAPKTYDMNASIYIWKREAFKREGLFHSDTYCYLMPEERSVDIDSPLDLKIVSMLLSERADLR